MTIKDGKMVKIDCIFFLFSISFEKKKQGNLMVVKLSFCIFVYFGWFLILRKTLKFSCPSPINKSHSRDIIPDIFKAESLRNVSY